jgi:hypothetical protein
MQPLSRFESVPRREPEQIESLIRVLREQMAKDYPPRKTKRDAHPKHHALLEAELVVEPNLDSGLRVGLFREPKTYRAFVRSSSASGKIQPDSVADLRGFAIKVTGVDGAPASPDDEPGTQDFVLLSYHFMPLGTVALFHDAIYHSIKTHRLLFVAKMIVTGRKRILHQLDDARRHATSPLDIRYWSTTPYLFGPDRVAKYTVVPTSAYKSELPSPLGETYLRDNMARHLSAHEATFDFKVQVRSDPAKMHVEDSAIEWKESETPFVKVATLRIPKQDFATREREELAENLRFTPGHALVDHRGIGGLNRARTQIYRALSRFRHERNGVEAR